MSCPTCGRKAVAGECAEGYMKYLSGEFPCPFNPDALATPRNLVVLPPLSSRSVRERLLAAKVPADLPARELSSDGLEDLL